MIVSCEEMKALEAKTFAAGVSAESLMEEAGLKIAQVVRQFFPTPWQCLVFFGKGHNGGDALVAARHLAACGWEIKLQPAFPEEAWSELTAQKHRELISSKEPRRHEAVYFYGTRGAHPAIILDGLLGIGAGGALRNPILAATREINRLRSAANARVFAVDLPTGLNADTGDADAGCVAADFTLAIGFAKKGLLAGKAANFAGRLAVLPLEKFSALKTSGDSDSAVATGGSLAPLLPRRKFDSHKNDYGSVGVVAGSIGMTGAALMSAEAALRAGAGLVTLFATTDVYPILAPAAAPEIMVRPLPTYRDVLEAKLDVIAAGPGLGVEHTNGVMHIVKRSPLPMVVDADALNMLSANKSLLNRFAGPRLLTPHPGEMNRLFDAKNLSRREIAQKFTERFAVTLLLKGARTLVAENGLPFSYNSTGSPGMATGGMGDVLTGVCAALLAQGLSCYDAARLGAWICGRAAEIAIYQGAQSEESLVATDLLKNLGAAFKQLREGCF